MCNMINDDWNIDHRRWSEGCFLARGDHIRKSYTSHVTWPCLVLIFGFSPPLVFLSGIACIENTGSTNGRTNLLLVDVIICFDLNLHLIDCKAESYGGCSKKEVVNFYPDILSVKTVKVLKIPLSLKKGTPFI